MSLSTRVLKNRQLEITQIYKPGVHNGIDIVGANYTLDDIIAHSAGKVVAVRRNATGFESGGSYGNYVKIEHSDGYQTLYAHMVHNSATVNVGDTVEEGQLIGSMGNTGTSYGAHVHFEVRENGKRIDPTPYLNADLPHKTVEPTKSVSEIADEVLNGDWGNQPERQQRLEAAGYNYEEVRAEVNRKYYEANAVINAGDSVIVNGRGTASSNGTGPITRMFTNHTMKVIAIAGGRTNAYACNQYNEGRAGDYTKVTAWFSKDSLKKV